MCRPWGCRSEGSASTAGAGWTAVGLQVQACSSFMSSSEIPPTLFCSFIWDLFFVSSFWLLHCVCFYVGDRSSSLGRVASCRRCMWVGPSGASPSLPEPRAPRVSPLWVVCVPSCALRRSSGVVLTLRLTSCVAGCANSG